MIKKIFSIFVILILITFSFVGCKIKSKTEISLRETVTIVGIDQTGDQIMLTIAVTLIQPAGATNEKISIYTSKGSSMFEAIQKFHPYTDRNIFWGHIDYVIIGEDAAKSGTNKYIDFLARDHEIKQNIKILVSKGLSANELINVTNTEQSFLSDTLSSLFGDIKNIAYNNEVSILQYMQMISYGKNSLYIPAITITNKKVQNEKNSEKKQVMLDGYAIFHDDILFGYLENNLARGMNWVINKENTGYMTIYDKKGKIVVVEVTHTKPSLKVQYKGEAPYVEINIKFATNIVEYQGKEDIFKNSEISNLVDQQSEIVKNEITEVVAYLQKNKIDVLGICNQIYHKYPKETTKYSNDSWLRTFKNTNISVKVESTIDRTYNINEPANYDERDEK